MNEHRGTGRKPKLFSNLAPPRPCSRAPFATNAESNDGALMTPPPTLATNAKNKRPTMIVLSHLRWDFVFQRPQHLLSRAARDFDVIFLEEPIFGDEAVPRLEVGERPQGLRVAQPILPHGTSDEDAIEAQRAILDELVAAAAAPLILWYY